MSQRNSRKSPEKASKGETSSIGVYARVRPNADSQNLADVEYTFGNNNQNINWPHRKGEETVTDTFTFTQCFTPQASQREVYLTCVEEIIDNFIKGYNCSFLAYGQTASGKTYTILGPSGEGEELTGMVPQAVGDIFSKIESLKTFDKTKKVDLDLSVFEIHNEKQTDMLDWSKKTDKSKKGKLQRIRETSDRGVQVEGLNIVMLSDESDAMALIQKATGRRRVASTSFNEKSSRSHLIYKFTLKRTGGDSRETVSSLFMVDLAGSEKSSTISGQKKTSFGLTGEMAKAKMKQETKNINTSLFALKRVIEVLSQNNQNHHVPFRDSVLTQILATSLKGNSKTCIILNIAPEEKFLTEGYNTLLFGRGASRIKNTVKKIKTWKYNDQINLVEKLRAELKWKDVINFLG